MIDGALLVSRFFHGTIAICPTDHNQSELNVDRIKDRYSLWRLPGGDEKT